MMFINYGNFIEDYVFKHACIDTSIVFVMWPRRCYFTNKILFLKYVYRQTAMWTGPGDPIFEYRDRKSTRLNSSHSQQSRMPSSA